MEGPDLAECDLKSEENVVEILSDCFQRQQYYVSRKIFLCRLVCRDEQRTKYQVRKTKSFKDYRFNH
jgi:hypothetical protein